jgi:hypothetical protein
MRRRQSLMRKKSASKTRNRSVAEESRKKRTIQAPPLESLLVAKPANLDCVYLQEPELAFAGKQRCVDPKTGLAAYGPYSKTDASRRQQLRIGIVGPSDAIDKTLAFLGNMANEIDQNEKTDAVLHPSFPGINSAEPFQVELASQTVWQRALRAVDVRLVEQTDDFRMRIGLLTKFVSEEVNALAKLDVPPDVVICAMTPKLEELCRTGIAQYEREHEEAEDEVVGDLEEANNELGRSFRRGLKAA